MDDHNNHHDLLDDHNNHHDFDHHDHNGLGHHDIGYEEANSIHDSNPEAHPNEGEHPFTNHRHHNEYDDTYDDHHADFQTEAIHNEIHHNHHDDLPTGFKSHSGGIHEEVSSLADHSHLGADHGHLEDPVHDGHGHHLAAPGFDEADVEQITKNVVKAVMRQHVHQDISKKNKISKKNNISKKNKISKKSEVSKKNKISRKNEVSKNNEVSKKSEVSKKNKISKKKRHAKAEVRKRTLQNLYVCECPPGYLGAHCQRKL